MKLRLFTFLVSILFCNFLFAQGKDTIFGNVKSIKEELIFLDINYQNRKLFASEGDFGHNGFLSEEYTVNRFSNWWYDTFWVHYINYYKEFEPNKKLAKVAWYYKDQSVLTSCENKYDVNGKLILQKWNTYKQSITTFSYDEKNRLIQKKDTDSSGNFSTYRYVYDNDKIIQEDYFDSEEPKKIQKKEYSYDSTGNLITLKNYDEYGESYGTKFEYDKIKRKRKIINHSPFIWVKTKTGSSQKRVEGGNDQISREFIYDDKDRIIETKSYNPDSYDNNKASIYRREVNVFNGKNLLQNILSYNEHDSLVYYKTFEYNNKNQKIKEYSISPKYPENNITLQYFYENSDFPHKLIYTDNNASVIVDFEYIFDKKKNWIEQTKSINGKKLYLWKRELKYYD